MNTRQVSCWFQAESNVSISVSVSPVSTVIVIQRVHELLHEKGPKRLDMQGV